MQSNKLNLNDFITDTASGENEIAENVDTTAMTVFEVPENLNLSLKANFKEVIFQKIDIKNLTGNITVSDGTARMNPLNLDAFFISKEKST